MIIVILDALWTEGFDAGAGRTKVSERLPFVLHARVLDKFGR
jgi:hypothetical protein